MEFGRLTVGHHEDVGGEEDALKEPEQESTGDEATEVLDESVAQADQTPGESHAGDGEVELKSLDEQSCWDLNQDVEDVEDRDGNLFSRDKEHVSGSRFRMMALFLTFSCVPLSPMSTAMP